MAIPQAAISPFGPDLSGFKQDPEGIIGRVRDDLDEVRRAVEALSRLATTTEGPDNAELAALIVALTLQVVSLDERVTALEGAAPSTGTGFEPRRGLLSAIGDPETWFNDNNPFYWETRAAPGKGDIWYVAMRDSTIWVWEPFRMLGLP